MNCEQLAADLERTLLRQRDVQWLREARLHAEHCPSCERLLELQQLEQQLTALATIEPSCDFLETVMNRVSKLEPVAIKSPQQSFGESFRYLVMSVGAILLAAACMIPLESEGWLSGLRPAPDFVRFIGGSAFLFQHPSWAILLSSIASLLVVYGLTMPERELSKTGETAPAQGNRQTNLF